MSGFQGADTAALTGWSEQGASAQQALAELLETCASAVAAVEWVGPDAISFREQFAHLQSRWTAASDALGERSTDARQQAEEQDRTSSEDSAVGLPGDGPINVTDPLAGGAGNDDIGRLLSTMFSDPRMSPFGFSTDPDKGAFDKFAAFLHFLADTAGAPLELAAKHLTRAGEDLLDVAARVARAHADEFADLVHDGLDKLDSVKDLGKMGKLIGGIDIAVSAAEAGKAIYDGRTGDAIGKIAQVAFELSPPGRAFSVADSVAGFIGVTTGLKFTVGGQQIDLSSNSPLDLAFQGLGNQFDDSPVVNQGERTGQEISNSLGLSQDGHARKALTAGGGVAGYLGTVANPALQVTNLIGWGLSKARD